MISDVLLNVISVHLLLLDVVSTCSPLWVIPWRTDSLTKLFVQCDLGLATVPLIRLKSSGIVLPSYAIGGTQRGGPAQVVFLIVTISAGLSC